MALRSLPDGLVSDTKRDFYFRQLSLRLGCFSYAKFH